MDQVNESEVDTSSRYEVYDKASYRVGGPSQPELLFTDRVDVPKKVLAIKYGDESDSDDEDCDFQPPKGLETNDIDYVPKRPRRESLPEIVKSKLRKMSK